VTNNVELRTFLDTEVIGTAYQEVSFVYNIPANCSTVRLDLRCPTTIGGACYFDDAAIQKRNVTAEYITRPAKNPGATAWEEVRSLGTKILLAMTASGTLIARSTATLYKSDDEGATWTELKYSPPGTTVFPDTISSAKVTASGYLIVFGATNQKVYRSNAPAWDTGFTEVLTFEGAGTRVEAPYGASSYGDLVLAGEYQSSDGTPRVYLSRDAGATWSKIYTLPNMAPTHHIHNVAYDPYDDVFWIVTGDATANRNIYYSAPGTTNFTRFRPPNKCISQLIQIIPLPECVVFTTDANPNGAYILKRRSGLPGVYEELILSWNFGAFAPILIGGLPAVVYGADACGYFGWMYDTDVHATARGLWATRDGLTFTEIAISPDIPTGAGDGTYGIRMVFGPAPNGYLYGHYAKGAAGNFLFRVQAPTWS
jgi:hypothetical protein